MAAGTSAGTGGVGADAAHQVSVDTAGWVWFISAR